MSGLKRLMLDSNTCVWIEPSRVKCLYKKLVDGKITFILYVEGVGTLSTLDVCFPSRLETFLRRNK